MALDIRQENFCHTGGSNYIISNYTQMEIKFNFTIKQKKRLSLMNFGRFTDFPNCNENNLKYVL